MFIMLVVITIGSNNHDDGYNISCNNNRNSVTMKMERHRWYSGGSDNSSGYNAYNNDKVNNDKGDNTSNNGITMEVVRVTVV